MKEKLQVAKELMDTQLESKHIEESCSPWNSPIFVIKKKSNEWHLLTDLRKVNAPIGFIDALTLLRSVRRCHLLDFFFITKIEFQGEQDSSICFNFSCVSISSLVTCNFSFVRGHCSVQIGLSYFQVILIIVLFVK